MLKPGLGETQMPLRSDPFKAIRTLQPETLELIKVSILRIFLKLEKKLVSNSEWQKKRKTGRKETQKKDFREEKKTDENENSRARELERERMT